MVFATDGKDAETVAAFADDLPAHRGDPPNAVTEVCIDMGTAFIKGTAESLPKAAVTFDKFHAVKFLNDGVGQVRRAEKKSQTVLRRCYREYCYLWLRNRTNLPGRQRAALESFPTRHLKTGRVYQIRLALGRISDPSRSTRLLVNGTRGSVRNRSTSSLRVLSRAGGCARRAVAADLAVWTWPAGGAAPHGMPGRRQQWCRSAARSGRSVPGFSGIHCTRARLTAWQSRRSRRCIRHAHSSFSISTSALGSHRWCAMHSACSTPFRVSMRLPMVMHDNGCDVRQQAACFAATR